MCDFLIKYISGIAEKKKKKTVVSFKHKIVRRFKTNTVNNYIKQTCGKNVYKVQKLTKLIIDKIISETRIFFEQEEKEEDYFKPEKYR